jgi:hypothetical protein
LVPPNPFDVHRPSGLWLTHVPGAEAPSVPPWTSIPLQSSSPGTRAVPPVSRLARRHFLSWTSRALRHSPRPVDSCLGSGSLRRPVPRSRFGYLLRDYSIRPSRRLRIGASMGFPLQGLPLAAIGTPLGALALLPLPAARVAQRAPRFRAAGFRALFLQRVRSVTRVHTDPGRRFLPGIRPSRVCSHPTWRSLCVATPPLSPFGGLTSRSTWASGYCGTNGWVDPSPDRQLSWASLPSDDHSAPFIAPPGGRMALPHARRHADGASGRSMPFVRDATTDPGPVARHRRQSVRGW